MGARRPVENQSLVDGMKMFLEILYIRWNAMVGTYRRPAAIPPAKSAISN